MTTPRIAPMALDAAPPEAKPVFDAFYAQRGNVPNMFRTLALRPEIMTTAAAHMKAILGTGTLPLRLKEMMAVRVSQMNGCRYCLSSHSLILKQTGATDETIDEMTRWADSGAFDEKERAALAFAEQMTLDAKAVSDELYAELARHFDDGEIIELASVIGLFNYFNRFNDALRVEITR
jgi:uncharacterized peroxidase-related enzyme